MVIGGKVSYVSVDQSKWGIDMQVGDLVRYNEDGDIDLANRPRCYISSECGNLIDSLINYQSNGKADEALKDFFDLIRYLRMANGGLGPDHFTNNSLESTKVGSGGY